MDAWLALLGVVAVVVALLTWMAMHTPRPLPPAKYRVGDLSAESLRYYCGYDIMRPVLLAVQGKVYDVTPSFDLYGPGKPYHVYAGREVARALAVGSLQEDDCCGGVEGLSPEQLQQLREKVAEFDLKYDEVGKVVPLRDMTLEQLAQHDGSDPSKPLYLAIKGMVFDITKGKQFYGPDGVYPFAGKEVARAFALLSTDTADCNDNLEGLSYTELENLREWTAKFNFKYPVVGRIARPGGPEGEGEGQAAAEQSEAAA